MSHINDDEPLVPGETETNRVARSEDQMPNGGQMENDSDPENDEGTVDPDMSDPADVIEIERVKGMRPA